MRPWLVLLLIAVLVPAGGLGWWSLATPRKACPMCQSGHPCHPARHGRHSGHADCPACGDCAACNAYAAILAPEAMTVPPPARTESLRSDHERAPELTYPPLLRPPKAA
ncbi:MAG TPA: hypothetical protein VFE31_01520 [Opitutaceae bacterium]|jgi:hypothetical protein|nr:hypothetical protein [Opitutaceae bacterium]